MKMHYAFALLYTIIATVCLLLAFLAEWLLKGFLRGRRFRHNVVVVVIYAVILVSVVGFPGILKPIGKPFNVLFNLRGKGLIQPFCTTR